MRDARTEPGREASAWWVGGLIVLTVVALVALSGGGGAPGGRQQVASSPIAPPPILPTATAVVAASPAAPAPDGADAAFANQDGRAVVCLDPGHGGTDEGHVRVQPDGNRLLEKDLTLTVGQIVAERLRSEGIEVVMTRTGDTVVNVNNEDVNGDGEVNNDPELTSTETDDVQARTAICNEARADLLISIHFNGADNPDLNGYEVFYNVDRPFADRSVRFAELLYEEFGTRMTTPTYAVAAHGMDTEDFAVLGPARGGRTVVSQMPGALGEALYLSNDADAAFVLGEGALFAVALAYENAIVRYLAEYPG